MKLILILLIPSIGWCGPFIAADPLDNVASYIIYCDNNYVEEVAAEPDGSLFYDTAGRVCSEWSLISANSAGMSAKCFADDTDCDGDVDGKDLIQLIELGFQLDYFSAKFGSLNR